MVLWLDQHFGFLLAHLLENALELGQKSHLRFLGVRRLPDVLDVKLIHILYLIEALFGLFIALADIRLDQKHQLFVGFFVDIVDLFAPQLNLLVHRDVGNAKGFLLLIARLLSCLGRLGPFFGVSLDLLVEVLHGLCEGCVSRDLSLEDFKGLVLNAGWQTREQKIAPKLLSVKTHFLDAKF